MPPTLASPRLSYPAYPTPPLSPRRALAGRSWRASNAHGGGILHHQGTYYWFGEHKEEGDTAEVGVHVYSSTDLYNWHDRGIALAVEDDPASEITRGCIIERPKVIFNASTGQFVLWFHLELKGQGRKAGRSAAAIADQPTGPYRYLHSLRPNPGIWPLNVTKAQKTALADGQKLLGTSFWGSPHPDRAKMNFPGRDFYLVQMAKDMNLFVDDDGAAYHIYSSEENATLHFAQLTPDGCSHNGRWVRHFDYLWHEAPAVFKHQGRYWLLSSHCTGRNPNTARAAVADSIWGLWQDLGNPCVGATPSDSPGGSGRSSPLAVKAPTCYPSKDNLVLSSPCSTPGGLRPTARAVTSGCRFVSQATVTRSPGTTAGTSRFSANIYRQRLC